MNWAYIAGYFDGEGHVGLHKNQTRNGKITTLSWYNSHIESLQAMKEYIGAGYIRQGNGGKTNRKPVYVLSISRKKDILSALDNMMPYLIIKREAAENLRVHLIENVNEKRAENYGKLLDIPAEQYEQWYHVDGKSLAQIAAMIGATPSGVIRIFRVRGIKTRSAGGAHMKGVSKSEETRARMRNSRRKLWEDPVFREAQLHNLALGKRTKA